jgi:hypothetical protein
MVMPVPDTFIVASPELPRYSVPKVVLSIEILSVPLPLRCSVEHAAGTDGGSTSSNSRLLLLLLGRAAAMHRFDSVAGLF